MKYWVSLAAVAVVMSVAAAQEKDDNPYRKAQVGDWVEYKVTTTVGATNTESTVKMTVTDKTDKEVTVKTAATVNGVEQQGQESKIDLTKPYDATATGANLPKGTEVKSEKVEDGREKIKVGTKDYDCSWARTRITAKVNGGEFEGDVKVWVAKEVPLSGFVRVESTTKVMGNTVGTVVEYAGSGGK